MKDALRILREQLETLLCYLIVPLALWLVPMGVQAWQRYEHYLPNFTQTAQVSDRDTHCPGCIKVKRNSGDIEWVHVGRDIALARR